MILEKLVSEYKDSQHPFPDDGMKPDIKKEPSFFLLVAKAMLNQYFNNQSIFPYQYTKTRSISELRTFAKGEQDVNQYKPWICQALAENGNKAYMNISWAPVRSIPKFRNVIKGLAIKASFDININALDPSSVTDRKAEEAYWRLQTDPEWVAFSKEMEGLGARVQKSQFQSEEQVNMWIKSGGVKLAKEIGLKIALQATMYLSKFEDSVKIEVIDDFIDLAKGVVRDYVEPGTRYVKARYVDPEYYIGRFSQFLDSNNSDYGGEIRFMTIGEIRAESDLTDTELFVIAKKHMNDYANAKSRFDGMGIFNSSFSDRYRTEYGTSPIDDFKVPVLDGVYISSDDSFYTKVVREGSGNLIYNEVSADYELSTKERKKGKSIQKKSSEVIYKFKYILGTEFVFDYGLDNDIAHEGTDGNKRAVNPYHVYNLGTSSVVDLMIPFENDMCLSTYKWRNAKARMIPPPGIYIEKGIFENLTLGGVKMSPKQAISMGMETGYLVGQSLSDHGRQSLAANSAPVTALPNTAMDYFNVFFNDMNYNFSQLKDITGINDITAGSDPNPRQGLGTAKIAIQSSNNTLLPLFKGYEVVFEQTMRSCAKRWQAVLRNGDVEGHFKALGSNNIEVFKLTKDVSMMDFGLTLEALPTDQEKQLIMEEIISLKAANVTNGSGGISPENYLLIYESIRSGNLKQAQLQLGWAIHEQRMLDHKLAMDREEMNGKIQQKSNADATLAKQSKAEQEHGYKMDEMDKQAQIDKNQAADEHGYTMAEIERKGQFGIQEKVVTERGGLTKEILRGNKKEVTS